VLSDEGFPLLEGPGLPRELQSASVLDSSRGPSCVEEDVIDYSWQDDAACKGMDIDLFYIGKGKRISQEVVDTCTTCPVNASCLQHALEREEYGYWANTNSKDRVRMRKELGIKLKPINIEFLIKQEMIESDRSLQSLRKANPSGKMVPHRRKNKGEQLDSEETLCL
jgi:WhiB family transcriptional regulator, redox-sensing transcriptional regulator